MALGASAYLADAWLNALGNNTSFAVATPYLKLFIGDPGASGSSNAATETTRKLVSFGTSSSGAMANDADIVWTNIAGSQDATHVGMFDHVSAGNFLASGTLTANAYIAGDTLTIPAGDLDLTMTVAS